MFQPRFSEKKEINWWYNEKLGRDFYIFKASQALVVVGDVVPACTAEQNQFICRQTNCFLTAEPSQQHHVVHKPLDEKWKSMMK